MKHLKYLEENSFSLIGEDDFSLTFNDGNILLVFTVERYSDSLSVWVEYLGNNPVDDNKYRLDIIMRLYLQKDMRDAFNGTSDEDKARLVKNYVDFVLNNKAQLFGKLFPLAKEYHEFNKKIALSALERFAKK